MCWELTGSGAQELDFLQIFPMLLTLVSVCVTAEELVHAGPEGVGEMICLWFDSYIAQTDTIKSV